jgi:hypothetical protein
VLSPESCEQAANGTSPGKTHFSSQIQSAVEADLEWITRDTSITAFNLASAGVMEV